MKRDLGGFFGLFSAGKPVCERSRVRHGRELLAKTGGIGLQRVLAAAL